MRRHWYFLAEIMDFVTLVRLQMEIKDIAENKVDMFFYTDSRGREIAPALLTKGYTIAILYAKRHAFMFSPARIRLEDPRMMKVRPYHTDALFEEQSTLVMSLTRHRSFHFHCKRCWR